MKTLFPSRVWNYWGANASRLAARIAQKNESTVIDSIPAKNAWFNPPNASPQGARIERADVLY